MSGSSAQLCFKLLSRAVQSFCHQNCSFLFHTGVALPAAELVDHFHSLFFSYAPYSMGFSRRRRRAKASQNFLDHDHKDVSTSSQFYQMPSELVEPSSLLNEPGKSQDTHGTEITPALNTANPGDRLLGSRKKNTTAYGDIEESLKHIGGNSYKGKSYIVCLYFDCDIRAISRLAMSQESASLDNPIEYNIREHVIFVSSEPRDEGSKAMGIKASTCIEFMQQRWGAQGVQLLTDVSRLCAMGVGTRLQNGTFITRGLLPVQTVIHIRLPK